VSAHLVGELIRFVSSEKGTIEEKIFQRQVMKQGISGAVVDDKFQDSSAEFSAEDLKV
jgi:SNF2 family DNA or RNA helicase